MSRPATPGREYLVRLSRALLTLATLLFVITIVGCGGVSSRSSNNNPGTPGGAPPPSGGISGGPGGGSTNSGGAGGGTNGPGGGGGGTGSPVPGGGSSGASSTFVYVVDSSPNAIETYRVDTNSGALTPTGPAVSVGHNLGTLAVNPNGAFAYGVGSDVLLGSSDIVVESFSLDRGTGLPTLIQTLTFPGGVGGSVAVDPFGRFVFVAFDNNSQSGSGILTFSVQSDGTLLQSGGLAPTDVNPGHITIDSKGRYLFTATEVTNKIWGFSIDGTTGTLIPVPTTPFTLQRTVPQAGKEPTDINVLFDPVGQRLFAVDNINSRVNAFTVDQTTGAITFQGATTSAQFMELFAPAIDPSGRFLYVAEFNTNAISGFNVSDANSPIFPMLPGLPVMTSGAPNLWMVVDATGKFAYSVEVDAVGDIGHLDGYSIDQNTGTLTRLSGTPITPQGSPSWIAITR